VLRLSDLNPGEIAKICGFHQGDKPYRQKLLAMGLTPNTEFEVIRRAPFGDPIEIRVRDFYLSLRQEETALLKIERVK
jgi:Fe2+ transport system protein FeoA